MIFQLLAVIYDSMAYMVDVNLYLMQVFFVNLVRADIALMQGLDAIGDWELSANPVIRGLVTAVFGSVLAFFLMACLAAAVGLWWIPALAGLLILGAFVLGLLADPESQWEVGSGPRWGSRRGPDVPLNL